MADKLSAYQKKRHFDATTEPSGRPDAAPEARSGQKPATGLRFVVQHHIASRDHYDFRLEWDGVLKSWAVPKGPSYDSHDKRLAVQVEDHPLEYREFEGTIPKGEYGGGVVMIWDEGTWTPLVDPAQGLADGSLKFILEGRRLRGKWALVRMKPREGEKNVNWLLIKERDEYQNADDISRYATSVTTGRTMDEIEAGLPLPRTVVPKVRKAGAKPGTKSGATARAGAASGTGSGTAGDESAQPKPKTVSKPAAKAISKPSSKSSPKPSSKSSPKAGSKTSSKTGPPAETAASGTASKAGADAGPGAGPKSGTESGRARAGKNGAGVRKTAKQGAAANSGRAATSAPRAARNSPSRPAALSRGGVTATAAPSTAAHAQAESLTGRDGAPAKAAPRKTGSPSAGRAGLADFRFTNPDKVLFQESGITKGDVARYYLKVADRMLPYLENRILSAVRCPSGVEEACFYKKHPANDSPGVVPVPVTSSRGTSEEYFYVEDVFGLMSEVQMNTVEFHLWGSRFKTLEKPDMMVIDLDPDEGLDLERVRQGVRDLKSLLDDLSLVSFLKTTGGKGYHVVLPFRPAAGWEAFQDFARNMARTMEAKWPDRYTSNVRKIRRENRIFIDWIRNGRGATSIAPYSVRAREGAPVSMPIAWKELDAVAPDEITMAEAIKRLRRKDPWADFFSIGQRLK